MSTEDMPPPQSLPSPEAPIESPPPKPPEPTGQPGQPAPVLVVGIGTSAGGLEALQSLFAALPVNDLAFIVVSHLDSAARGRLPEVLRDSTRLPITQIRGGERVTSGQIYIAPAGCVLEFAEGLLKLSPIGRNADVRNPIDIFFQSLGEQYQACAVGIILSGNGTDGTHGLKSISDAGGMTFAQEPTSAKYDSMPRSAATLGMADRSLAPEKIAEELMLYARHVLALTSEESSGALNQQISDSLVTICGVLQEQTEHNFKHYKTSTLVRRIGRRMQVLRISSAEEYAARLNASREEVSALFRELLIGVTAFFRDPEAFEVLAKQAIPAILEHRTDKDPVRVWVPGCASGEEAYTLAMLFREALDRLGAPLEILIFATDINEHALRIARQGAYPLSIAEDLSPERLQRFFIKKGNRYHVTKELRELCLFSSHDLIRDPPFSRLDLISCRNLLIYLGQHLQKKLVPLFHYALRPAGFLFLGPSESISSHRELFRPVDVKHRISQRLSTAVRSSGLLNRIEGHRGGSKAPDGTLTHDHDLHLVMQRIVLDEFAPKSVVVNEEGQILCASGGLERFLGISSGIFQNNVVKLAHSGLRVELRTALSEAVKTARTVVHEGVTVRTEKGAQRLKLTVQPMPQLGEQSGLYLVVFQDAGAAVTFDVSKTAGSVEQADALIEQLERELHTTREDLEKTIQDLEAANEELKSSNEELLSMNEELQSANEEMETSKEEIQAANEALGRSNSDLENLLASTRIATLFLDEDLHIVRFTQAMTDIFNLIPTDVGRRLSDITHCAVNMPPLPNIPLREGSPENQTEVQTVEGSWYIRRVLPYRNQHGQEQGVVVTFNDVTALKAAQQALERSEQNLRRLADAMPQLVWTALPDGRRDYFNRRWYEYTGQTPEQALGDRWMQAIHPEDREAALAAWNVAVQRGALYETEYHLRSASGEYQWFLGRGVPVRDGEGNITHWFGTATNIHSQKLAEEALQDADHQKNLFLAMLAHELRNPLSPILTSLHLLRERSQDIEFTSKQHAMIERQIQQMKRLLDDLLDVARITRGHIAVHDEVLDLRGCLDQAVEAVRFAFDAKQHRLTRDIPTAPIYVLGDAVRLTQVFTNLLHNAAKFTANHGAISIEVAHDAERVRVRIKDNGIGMSNATLHRAFDLFAQETQSLDRSEGGLGIGLTLVKRLVGLHHGTVAARSDGIGLGSELIVELPLSKEAPAQGKEVRPVIPQTAAAPHRVRVVVVDDNTDAAEAMASLLELASYESHVAYDGPSGVALVTQIKPDIAILDIGLPRLDGYQVAKKLRATPGLEKTVLIALSGYGHDEARNASIEAGFNHYLVKPVSIEELLQVLEQVMPRS